MGHANKSIKVGSLRLDSRNTRIPSEKRSNDERALIHELLQHENVAQLAKSIADHGLFPTERLVVIQNGRRYIVLEGNRRLAAIKILLNPELARDKKEVRKFRRYGKIADLEALDKVDVTVFDSRIEAAPIIAALHTKQPKRRWERVQQAQFYQELLDDGLEIDEIADDLGVSLAEVRDSLRAGLLYRIAKTFEYPDEVRKQLESRRFALTNLARFIQSTSGRKFLGIELDDENLFKGAVSKDRFIQRLSRVATEVATGERISRELNKEEDFARWTGEVAKELPDTQEEGEFLPHEFISKEAPEDSDPEAEQPKPKPARRKSRSIVPTGFRCTVDQAKVRALFRELRSLNLSKQPNSTAVMLRVLVDVALWAYLKEQGHDQSAVDNFDKNGKKRGYDPNWSPSLRQLVSYTEKERLLPGMTPDAYKSLRMILGRKPDDLATLDTLNAYTHNPQVQPTEQEVQAVWDRVEPMLKIILK